MSFLSPDECRQMLSELAPMRVFGKINKVVGLVAEGSGIKSPLGAVCHVQPDDGSEPVPAEVVGFRDGNLLLMPYGEMRGICQGSLIRNSNLPPVFPVSDALLGQVFDAFGTPLKALCNDTKASDDDDFGRGDSGAKSWQGRTVPLYTDPPNPLLRPRIDEPLDVGVRAINSLLTLGKGQRVGIMAGSGVGKSTLMGMMARYTKADVNVIGLIGERGREVLEFIEKDLGPEGMARSVLIVATSDQSPLVRMRAAYAATAVAEFFRDQGKDVLLMMDSVTRFAMAAREVGLAVGEPPTTKGYTPTVFAQLPKLLERAGRSAEGSITGIYTVLVDGDDFNEPIADAVRSILDGHIVLTRDLADQGHFPAIDVLKSISRLRTDICSEQQVEDGRRITRLMATYRKVEDMVNIGAYVAGTNPDIDHAIQMHSPVNAFLQQAIVDKQTIEQSFAQLAALGQNGQAALAP